jgi:hypothetical protein
MKVNGQDAEIPYKRKTASLPSQNHSKQPYRQFAVLCPGLACGDAGAGLRNLARVVSQARASREFSIEA